MACVGHLYCGAPARQACASIGHAARIIAYGDTADADGGEWRQKKR